MLNMLSVWQLVLVALLEATHLLLGLHTTTTLPMQITQS
jgi:hypothetical protein